MKIYTKTGDAGDTGLLGGPRVRKDSLRIEAYGAVDELNAVLGLARAHGVGREIDGELATIQNELFIIGGQLATPDPVKMKVPTIEAAHIARLESLIDEHEAQLEPLRNFILPGGALGAATLHVARTVCRRAERRLVTLIDEASETVSRDVLVYLNRLSDLLFVLARAANKSAVVADVVWRLERP